MSKTLGNIRVYGDSASGVWVAPKGTTGPTTLAAPSGTYKELGWLSEDGVDNDRSEESTKFKGWQGGGIVRVKSTSVEDTWRFQCLEETATTLGLLYKGQVPTVATGVGTITVTNQVVTDERAWVIDVVDGSVTKRYVIPSGVAQLTSAIAHKNDDMTVLEFTVTAQGDYFVLSNNSAVIS